jgi:hypothetical protein
MVYQKNVPSWERVLRIVFGAVMAGVAALGPSLLNLQSPLIIGGILLTGAFVVLTGFFGWCPACALVGRKLKASDNSARV